MRDLVIEGRVHGAIRGRRGATHGIEVFDATKCTRAPAAINFLSDASDRARPVTSWPAARSSLTIANPINPVAPVTKTFLASSLSVNVRGLGQDNLCYCPVSEVR
jgi:hypothetical protein